MIITDILYVQTNKGYIAGTQDGIVTVGGKPASRKIYVFDVTTLNHLKTAKSLPNGHYLIQNLDPNRQYLIMCRDYERQYEPFVWDYVTPATDLSVAEQVKLWDEMQSM